MSLSIFNQVDDMEVHRNNVVDKLQLLSNEEFDLLVKDIELEKLSIEEYGRVIDSGWDAITKIEKTLEVESLVSKIDDVDVKEKLLTISTEDMKSCLTAIGMSGMVVSTESNDTIINKIIQAIKKIIAKIVKTTKKLYLKFIMYLANLENKIDMLIKDYEGFKDEDKVPDEIKEKRILEITGVYWYINAQLAINKGKKVVAIDDFIEKLLLEIGFTIKSAVADIDRLLITQKSFDEVVDRINYLPNNSITDSDMINAILKLSDVLTSNNKDLDVYTSINSGILLSIDEDGITMLVLTGTTSDDPEKLLVDRRFVTNKLYFKNGYLSKVQEDYDVSGDVEYKLGLLKNLKRSFKKFKPSIKNIEDFLKEHEKWVNSTLAEESITNPELEPALRQSINIFTKLITTQPTTKLISVFNMYGNLVTSFEIEKTMYVKEK